MGRPSAPDDAVPEFVRERFEDYALQTLREIERYARTDSSSADVLRYVVETFSLRDRDTRRAGRSLKTRAFKARCQELPVCGFERL